MQKILQSWSSQWLGALECQCVVTLTLQLFRLQSAKVLPCGHQYHLACLRNWLQHGSVTCPMCRANLMDEDGARDASSQRHSGALNPITAPAVGRRAMSHRRYGTALSRRAWLPTHPPPPCAARAEAERWEYLLRENGFGGLGSMFSSGDEGGGGMSSCAAQAGGWSDSESDDGAAWEAHSALHATSVPERVVDGLGHGHGNSADTHWGPAVGAVRAGRRPVTRSMTKRKMQHDRSCEEILMRS